MMKDYLIIAWITIVACWPITLPVLAVVAGILFYSRHRVAGLVVSGLFILEAVAAWQFERYM
ncbi:MULTISPECIES: hypothetical protein [Klebsiella]|uniref:hypothetical protein n=1 Tax=Klebsiella TaxID=570 RepID=UPI0005EE8C18|nr:MULTISPECIES: hypothetical protein [Klebsiella]EKU6610990.1 hypothetical protein [Klebsiella aerogenes]EKU8179558.1 hypothetical protein [Klebsiella aerogenes]EKW5857054.1 hypothetical protein [Klebsiella aerogenes]EKW8533723.1 hypothetical protein [Klebsiella aerogenes]EKZ5853658.1 hypothetical protein [Klebsiella aerogenes]